ncbi:hypothetical protein HG531_001546 [Fusarium graminearum]|nr:hypothetical protein HG531_001546 [Fusarium graminearum]
MVCLDSKSVLLILYDGFFLLSVESAEQILEYIETGNLVLLGLAETQSLHVILENHANVGSVGGVELAASATRDLVKVFVALEASALDGLTRTSSGASSTITPARATISVASAIETGTAPTVIRSRSILASTTTHASSANGATAGAIIAHWGPSSRWHIREHGVELVMYKERTNGQMYLMFKGVNPVIVTLLNVLAPEVLFLEKFGARIQDLGKLVFKGLDPVESPKELLLGLVRGVSELLFTLGKGSPLALALATAFAVDERVLRGRRKCPPGHFRVLDQKVELLLLDKKVLVVNFFVFNGALLLFFFFILLDIDDTVLLFVHGFVHSNLSGLLDLLDRCWDNSWLKLACVSEVFNLFLDLQRGLEIGTKIFLKLVDYALHEYFQGLLSSRDRLGGLERLVTILIFGIDTVPRECRFGRRVKHDPSNTVVSLTGVWIGQREPLETTLLFAKMLFTKGLEVLTANMGCNSLDQKGWLELVLVTDVSAVGRDKVTNAQDLICGCRLSLFLFNNAATTITLTLGKAFQREVVKGT